MKELLHNPMIQAYLASVCDQVRCREVHGEIRDELVSHIADRVEALMEAGTAESDAVAQALKQLGDPDVIGRQMHQLHRPRLDWWLLGAMAALVLVGIWAMYATTVSGTADVGAPVFPSQLFWSGIGLVIGAIALVFDYRRLQRLSWPLFGVITLAIGISAFGRLHTINGRPLFLEVSPLCYVPALAGIFAGWDWGAPRATWKAIGVLALPTLIYLQAGRHFPLLEYLFVAGVLVAASKPRRPQVSLFAAAGAMFAGMIAYSMLTTPHMRERLLSWLDPNRDPRGVGYQAAQSLAALRHAGLRGHGALANLPTLPEAHTDFVFPYLVHTLGWIAGGAVCLVALAFTARLMRAGRGVSERYGQFLIRGIAMLFALQFVWNLLMTMGLLPSFSVDLPFVSGGSQQVLYMALVGLTLSVFRRKTTTAKM